MEKVKGLKSEKKEVKKMSLEEMSFKKIEILKTDLLKQFEKTAEKVAKEYGVFEYPEVVDAFVYVGLSMNSQFRKILVEKAGEAKEK